MFEAVLPMFDEFCATPAGICTDTVPALGVTVNVYVVPEPERLDAVPPVTVISPCVSPVTDCENVAVTVNAEFTEAEDVEVRVTDGAVLEIL